MVSRRPGHFHLCTAWVRYTCQKEMLPSLKKKSVPFVDVFAWNCDVISCFANERAEVVSCTGTQPFTSAKDRKSTIERSLGS